MDYLGGGPTSAGVVLDMCCFRNHVMATVLLFLAVTFMMMFCFGVQARQAG